MSVSPSSHKRKVRESNPQPRFQGSCSAGSVLSQFGYLPYLVDPPRVDLGSPPRQGGVFPLDHEPDWLPLVFQKPHVVTHFTFVLYIESSLGITQPTIPSAERTAHAATSFAGGLSSATHSGAPGNRTPITWVQAKCLPVRPASRIHQKVRPGIEPGLPPYHSGVRPKHLQTFVYE